MTPFICSIPLISALFTVCTPPLPLATGYVEGEFVLIAPVATTQIETVHVRRGDKVTAGQILATTEQRDAEINLAETVAALAGAESQLANLREGRREDEIHVIEASLASARAQASEAEKEVVRLQNLLDRGVVSQAQFDTVETARDVAVARVSEMEANLAVARLPARPNEIAAAEANVAQVRARRDAAAWQLGKRILNAPSAGTVFEILRTAGEVAGPQAPVISMLPDGAVVLRLYVPEPAISGISLGARLRVNCDGCGDEARATVTYISDSPEFTPPVIYSVENRQKLVYLIEARPDSTAEALKPGQIVDVDYLDHE